MTRWRSASPPACGTPRRRLRALAVCLALLFCGMALRASTAPSRALALDNGLALTPYMGWNSYYGRTLLTEANVFAVTDAMASRGLRAAGYQYVWLDAGWWDGTRDDDGNIVAPADRWPHGLHYVTDYIHAHGLKAGIYTDAGADGCGGPGQGSGPDAPGDPDHYQQDADTFAAWGFDAVKADFCSGRAEGLDPETQFTAFGWALAHNSSGRELLYNICNPFTPATDDTPVDRSAYMSYSFAPAVANSWRTEFDIGLPGDDPQTSWDDLLRNLMGDAAHPEAAGPGHWNDPDYLVPETGMTPTEDQTQVTMWAMLAAPLMIGSDVRNLSDVSIAILTNREVIAVDQDPLGQQGVEVADDNGLQVWARDLATPGTRAVALLNTTDDDQTISVDWQELVLDGPAGVRDLWQHADLGTFADGYSATVPSHGAVLLLVRGTDAPQ